ncbi:MAG: hypothetical protein ABI678_21945 [Kofleriaceae bacterium]
MRVAPWLVCILGTGAVVSLGHAGSSAHTSITIWGASTAPAISPLYGGASYGAATVPTGAMIVDRHEVEVTASGEVRIAGVPATLDPASVQLRGVDGDALAVSEQRFVPGAASPDEILARHVGEPVTVQTPKGEVAGTLRSVDAQAIVVEVGAGDQRRLQVMRRDGYVQDIRLAVGTVTDRPSLVWRVGTKKPGKHQVEVSYRAEGLSWTTDYLAILDEAKRTLDFSAWATVKNATSATFDSAELTLVNPGDLAVAQPTKAAAPTRFVVPSAVRLGTGESVQVELFPPRTNAKARSVVTFEAMPDPSASFQQFQAVDCNQLSASVGTSKAEVTLEVDVPTKDALPDGRVRLFRRAGTRLEVVTEDPLRSVAGVARIKLSADNDVTGERHAASCNYDEHAHTIKEKIELKVENKSKKEVVVVAREFLWRWPMFRLEDESQKGIHAGAQIQEYRLSLPAGGKKSVTYTVIYSW